YSVPTYTHPAAVECLGRPETLGLHLRKVLHAGIGAQQAGDVVQAGAKVVDPLRVIEGCLNVVAERRKGEPRPVELSARVILVRRDSGPAVLVDVEDALAVDMALVWLQRRLDHPHTMQLPAHYVRIQMVRF